MNAQKTSDQKEEGRKFEVVDVRKCGNCSILTISTDAPALLVRRMLFLFDSLRENKPTVNTACW